MNSPQRPLVALLAFAALLAWLGQTTTTLAQEPPLIIQGEVINATTGGGGVSDLTVTFHQHGPSGELNDLETTPDEAGQFRFEGVTYNPGFDYAISVEYQGALYGRDLDLSAGSLDPIALTVYETTDDESVFSGTRISVLFAGVSQETSTLDVLEIVTLRNSSDRTYVPGPDPMKLLRFGLPAGSHNLSVDTGHLLAADVLQVDAGFALTASVPPGEYEVLYSYRVPYSGSTISIAKSLRYGAEQLRILAPEGDIRLSSSQLGAAEAITLGEDLYQLLTATDVPSDSSITIDLAGLPQSSLTSRLGQRLTDIPYEYVAPIGLTLLVVFLLGFSLQRRSARRRAYAAVGGQTPFETRRQLLLQRLADLQQRHESGDLTEEEFRTRRSEVQASLVSLVREEGRGTPASSSSPISPQPPSIQQ